MAANAPVLVAGQPLLATFRRQRLLPAMTALPLTSKVQPVRSVFVGFRRLKPGFLLYHDRNAFFFLPVAELSAGQVRRIEEIVADAGVPDLARKKSR